MIFGLNPTTRETATLAGGDRPTVAGAILQVMNPTTHETATLSMPAGRWTELPGGAFRYRDPGLASGPVRSAIFRGGRLAKVSARGAAIGFTLDEPSQGSLGAVLTSGQRRYCTLFGGHVKHDGPGTFGAVKAPPPGACPTPGG